MRLPLVALSFLALAVPVASAAPVGDPDVAALQVGLRQRDLYVGDVDGLAGPATEAAVRKLEQRAGLPARSALGDWGRPALGSRLLSEGMSGWDVAALQFLLAWHGFPSGTMDGAFGPRLAAAVLRFQEWADLPQTGIAGPLTLGALRSAPPRSPIPLSWPVDAPVGDLFGPRGDRFHAGVDFPAPAGAPVDAAGSGEVVYAGWRDGGWGMTVAVAHGSGVRTLYAHLSRIDVEVGERVAAGQALGLVGATGGATGPHLHFELRLRGAAIDPLSALR